MTVAESNSTIVRSLYDAFNAREFDRGAVRYADDAQLHNVATGETFRGPNGFREYVSGWAAAMPDARTHVQNVVASGDQVVVEFRGIGTHSGPLRTPAGNIPPTGRALELQVVEVFELQDGKVIDHRAYFDSMTMLKQMGVA